MTAPTLKNYFDVSSWMYGDATDDNLPPIPTGLDTFEYLPGRFDTGLDTGSGFHGAAFITDGPDPTVVIGFEGTDSSGITERPAFLAAQIQADLTLYFGYRPAALTQALDFARTVIATAEQQGISSDHVVVTGHSLGAGEAAYVATQLDLGGVTFAAPGLDQDFILAPGDALTNYVAYGDPVGNYSATPANFEGAFLFSQDIRRVGAPTYLDKDGAGVGQLERDLLQGATDHFDPAGSDYDPALGLLEVGGLAGLFHRLTFYGDQFSPSLNTDAPVQVDDSRIVSGVQYLQFYGDLIDRSGLVSDGFYNIHNPDVRASGIDPEVHYGLFGWREGRDPNPSFSTLGYRAANPDVASAATDPLAAYHAGGWRAGSDPGANFDAQLYLMRNPDVRAAGLDPLAHYLDFGRYEGRAAETAIGRATDLAATGGFDTEYYLLSNPDVAAAALRTDAPLAFAAAHYAESGWREGRDGNGYFDTKGYLQAYGDVRAAGVDPLAHYETFGWREGRDPSRDFDTKLYLSHNPDVARAGVDPLLHYLTSGIYEGRSPQADGVFA